MFLSLPPPLDVECLSYHPIQTSLLFLFLFSCRILHISTNQNFQINLSVNFLYVNCWSWIAFFSIRKEWAIVLKGSLLNGGNGSQKWKRAFGQRKQIQDSRTISCMNWILILSPHPNTIYYYYYYYWVLDFKLSLTDQIWTWTFFFFVFFP